MTHVLILGRTKMKQGHCVGGLELESGRNVRLQNLRGYAQPSDTPMNVGDIWDIQLRKFHKSQLAPPHTEDIGVEGGQFVEEVSPQKLVQIITHRFSPKTVHPKDLFDGRVQINKYKRARIWSGGDIPNYSVGFWRLDKTLHRCVNEYGSVRYVYCSVDASCDLNDDDMELDVPFTGILQKPIDRLSTGTILRFSLGRRYKGSYWLQLSGWFTNSADVDFRPRQRSINQSKLDMRTQSQRRADALQSILREARNASLQSQQTDEDSTL